MQPKEVTAGYVELATQTYNLFVDSLAAFNKRSLDYTKAVWEIASRPYEAAVVDAAVRENFARANKLVTLTVDEMQLDGQKAAELAETLARNAAKLQETYVQTLRGVVETTISNANFVTESATKSLEAVTKRVEDAQNHATATISNN